MIKMIISKNIKNLSMNWEESVFHNCGKWNESIGNSSHTAECLAKWP